MYGQTENSQKIKIDEEIETIISEVMKVNDKINKHNFRKEEEFFFG